MNRVLPPGPRSINTVRACVCACVHLLHAHRTVTDRRVSRTPSARVCAGSEISGGDMHRYFFSHGGDKDNKNFSGESAVLLLFFENDDR